MIADELGCDQRCDFEMASKRNSDLYVTKIDRWCMLSTSFVDDVEL